MRILDNYKSVLNTPQRREVLIAMTGGQLLVQLSSMPVTLALPSIARHFEASINDAAGIVIANLLVLGCTVFLGARLGDRFGHTKVFLIGAIIVTIGRSPHRRRAKPGAGDSLSRLAGTWRWDLSTATAMPCSPSPSLPTSGAGPMPSPLQALERVR